MDLMTRRPAETPQSSILLTTREFEILQSLIDGSSGQEIADRLCISRKTVEFHQMNIYRKLKVTSKMQAVYKAMQLGWVSLPPVKQLIAR
ncbi:MAG: response regulator transcription factor [Armatimonadetes bacterium]|nr:response regulator transcription factor [Armatimonadota bacterium]